MNDNLRKGSNYGSMLYQSKEHLPGGSSPVFVKLQGGGKQGLTFPPIGGKLLNPFGGAAKAFAGDRVHFNPAKGEVILIKEYVVVKELRTRDTNKREVYFLRDGFMHIPFVGDIIGKMDFDEPASGVIKPKFWNVLRILSVTETTVDVNGRQVDAWRVETDKDVVSGDHDLDVGDIMYEPCPGGKDYGMVVLPNAYLAADVDFPVGTVGESKIRFYDTANANSYEDTFGVTPPTEADIKAEYQITPVLADEHTYIYDYRVRYAKLLGLDLDDLKHKEYNPYLWEWNKSRYAGWLQV